MEASVGVLVGGALTFVGVTYAEWRHDSRDRERKQREIHRDSLRQVRDAYLAWETASHSLIVQRPANDIERISDDFWPRQAPGELLFAWIEATQLLTALRAELEDRDLAAKIKACQKETRAIAFGEPESSSDEDVAAFRDRITARGNMTMDVIEAIGTFYRKLP